MFKISLVPLSREQRDQLRTAIERYSFPSDYFNFFLNAPEHLENIQAVELRIDQNLTSGDPELVKNGLSNVLYWGYAQMGIRETRVSRFRSKVGGFSLQQACTLFRRSAPPVIEIKRLRLPEFSGLSFVSKIRMFLDPKNSATLDWQIMKMHRESPATVLAAVHTGNSSQIPITAHNSDAYEAWCRRMVEISKVYFETRFRAADVERGFFQLIQTGNVKFAAKILTDS